MKTSLISSEPRIDITGLSTREAAALDRCAVKIKVAEATGAVLNWLVAKCEGVEYRAEDYTAEAPSYYHGSATNFSKDWAQGGPIVERENITVIRANDVYGVDAKGFTTNGRMSWWFAEASQWVGHSICTGYEGENMDPTFMIGEAEGFYGPTPLIAAMRCYVAYKLGKDVEVPDELREANGANAQG